MDNNSQAQPVQPGQQNAPQVSADTPVVPVTGASVANQPVDSASMPGPAVVAEPTVETTTAETMPSAETAPAVGDQPTATNTTTVQQPA